MPMKKNLEHFSRFGWPTSIVSDKKVRQRCKHVELEQFLACFRVARFVSNS